MGTPHLQIRAGHPDFLDMPWGKAINDWDIDRLVDLPRGVHRHPVVFVAYNRDIYAIKELPRKVAHHEYDMLRAMREMHAPVVEVVGLVERPWLDPHTEGAGCVITKYLDYAFSYRELLSGPGFGARRNQMLNGFANLLVELHGLGVFWGDCSLSNVLYRFDAEALTVTMVDAETVSLHDELSTGQRHEDLDIMITNVAGGMADIAASQGVEIDDADLALGEDIAARYHALWDELHGYEELSKDERFRIRDRIRTLNEMGYEVDDVEIVPGADGNRIRFRLEIGGRRFHTARLRDLTGIEATERQARQILADLHHFQASHGADSPAGKAVGAVQWRVTEFEPMLAKIAQAIKPTGNPVQSFTDFLHHRYLLAERAGHDVDNDTAFEDWVASGLPGYPLLD